MSGYIALIECSECIVRASAVGRWTSFFDYRWWLCAALSREDKADASGGHFFRFDSYEITQKIDFDPGLDGIPHVSSAASMCGCSALFILIRSSSEPSHFYDYWRREVEKRLTPGNVVSGVLDGELSYSVMPLTPELSALIADPPMFIGDVPGFVALIRSDHEAADEQTVSSILFWPGKEVYGVIGWGDDGDSLVGLAKTTSEKQMISFATRVISEIDARMRTRSAKPEQSQ